MFRFPREPLAPIDEPTIDDDLGGGDLQDPIGGGGGISDTTRPSLTIKSFTRTINIAYNGTGSSTITVEATDYGSGIANVTIDGVQMLHTGGSTYVGIKAYNYNSSYAGTTRTNYFNIRATDGAGNITNASDYLNVVYASIPDNTAPSVSFTGASPTTVYLNNSTTAANVSLTVTASDTGGSGLASVSVNNGASQVYQYGSNWYFQKTFNFNDYGWGNTTVTFTATASDGAGNNSSATQNIVVNKSDSLAPTISSFTGPSSLNVSSSNQTATYAVTCSDNRGINSVSVGGASYSSQSGSTYYFTESFATSSYGFGTTSVSRTATVSDAAGNTATDSISFNVTKSDVTKPSISSFSVNDSTISLTTGSQTQTVTYTAKATDNRGINSYSLPNATFSSQSGSNYYWTETFSYGDYSFGNTSVSRTVTFYDAAGNSRSSTLSLTVTKSDTQSPSISGFSANNDSIALNNSTTSASRTFTVTVTDNVAVSNVTVDGLTYSSRSGNNWYFTKTFSFGDYSFGSQNITFVAVASDAAGNIATRNASVTVTKSDTQAPSISSFTVSDSSISVTSSNTSQTVNFAVTTTDNVGVDSVSVSGATYTGASGNTYNFSKTYSFSSYNYGTTNITETATVSDAAGNSTTSNKAMTVTKSDTTSPSISSFTVNDSSVSLTTSSTSQTVTFTVVTTDNRGISSVSVNNGASGGLNSGSSYYFTKTFNYDDYNWGNTTVTFTATATDAAGNSTSSTLNITVSKSDTQTPIIQDFTASGNVALTTSSTSQTVTYTVQATDNRAVTSYSVNGNAGSASGSGSTRTFTETFNYADYSFGSHTISRTATVSDAAGNSDSDTITFTLTKSDNQNPVISNYAAANTSLAVTSTSTSATATFTATITDNVAIDYVRFEGNPPTGSSGSTYTYVKTYNYSDLSFGSNSITVPCYAQDTAGNSATVNETITITKSDNTAPTISNLSVSRDASVTTDNQSDTIIITADVTDNTGVSSVTIPGATFVSVSGNTYTFRKTYEYDDYSFGDTLDTITVTATDTGGNDDDDEVQATVSKTDTQAPTITSFSVDFATVNLLTSAPTQVHTFTVVTSDNVGVSSVSVSGASQYSASGNTYVFHKTYRYADYSFGSSTDTVNLSVLDAAGNEATDSIDVTVVKSDDQAPSINSFSVNDSSVTLLSSSKTQTITFSANVTDNRSVTSISLSGGVTATDSTGPDYTWTKTFNYDDYNYGTVNQNFTLTASDAAGNQSTSTLTVSIAKTDDANPSITSIGRKNGSTAGITSVTLLSSSENTETVTFTVNVSDNVGVTGVTLSGATAVSNTATQYIFSKSYAFGDYSFGSVTDTLTATATDAAGNSSSSTTSITVIKTDNVAPTISNLSASSSTVALTSSAQNTETITFTATITDDVGINSVSFGGLTPSVSGNNYTWTKNYAYASYSFGSATDALTLTVTDAAGNSSSESVSVSITKTDNVAPTITSYSASATQLTWLASQNDSADKTVTFTVVTSDDVGVSSVAITGATQTNVSGSTYTFTKAFSRPVLGNAATSFAAALTVTDAAGNTSTDSITISTVYTDNVNPTITSFSADDTTVALTNGNQSQTVTFTGVATDNRDVTAVYFDNNSPDSSSGNTHTWTKTYSYGSYSFGNFTDTITFAASDAAGNTSTQDLVINISKTDTVAPTISSFTSSTSSVALTTSSQSQNVSFTVVATDNVGISGVTVSGATLVSNSGNTFGFTKSYSYSNYSFGSVNDSVVATATDAAGNSSTSTISIAVSKTDNQAPSISSFTVDDSSPVVSTSSQYQTVTFSVTATDNVAISSVSIPGATYASTSGNTRTFEKTYEYSNLDWGVTDETFTVTVTDTAGNTATDTVDVSVTKNDDQNPSISSFSVSDSTIELTTNSQSQTVTFTVVATDNRAVTSKSVTGATFVSQSGNTFTFSRTFNYADFSFGSSTRTVTATIGDAAGNTTSDTLTVNITKSDNQAPTITGFTSASVTHFANLYSTPNSNKTHTETFTITASDNVAIGGVSIPGATMTSSLDDGSPFTFTKDYEYDDYNYGSQTQTETVTVSDTAGNVSTSSITYTINKYDNSSPSISGFSVTDNTVVLTTSSPSQTVTFSATVSDNRAVTNVTIDGQDITPSGNTYSYSKTYSYGDWNFGANTNVVSIVATDAAGNTSTDSVTVSISKSDDQNPTISSFSADSTSVALKTSDQTKRVYFTAVVTDNVGVTSVTCSDSIFVSQSGSTYTFRKDYVYGNYSFGSNTSTHTLTATDAAGNSSTDSVTVTITKTDDQNPSISSFSVNDSTVSLTTTSQSQTIIFTAVVSDNVGINSISVTGATQSSVSGSTYTFTKSYAYADYNFGANTDAVTLTVSDAAGNTSTDSMTISVAKADNQAPSINSFTTSDNSFQLSTSSQGKTVTYSVNATDNLAIGSVTVSGATFTGASGSARTFSRSFHYDDFSFGSNTVTVTVTATDTGGNVATDTITHTITKVDDENPTVGTMNSTASDNLVTLTTTANSQTIRFGVEATDNRGISSVTWEGSESSTTTSGDYYYFDRTYNYSDYTVNSTNSDTISVVVADAAGNVTNKSKTITITTVDNVDPTISSFTSNKTNNIVELLTSAQNKSATFQVSTSDNVGVTSVSLPGTTAGSVSGGVYSFSKSYSYADYSFGDTTDSLTVTVSDAAGNQSTQTLNMTIRKTDDESPSISSFTADDTSVSLTTSSQTQTVTFTCVATDNVAVSTVSLPGTTDAGSSGNSYTFTKTYVYSDYSFGNSSDTLTVTVTDAAGNSSTQNITISINKADNANPSITSFTADDTSVSLTTSSQTQTVNFTVIATDNVGISSVSIPGTTSGGSNGNNYAFSKTYNYSDYSFGSSTDTLTVTVEDSAGNSVTDDITINISKSDNQSPSITSANNASGLSASTTSVALKTSDQSKTVTFTATLSDNVGISSVTFGGLTPSISGNDYTWTKTYDYDDYSFGSTTDSLTLTVADAAGNTSTDSVTINISKTDDQNPSVVGIGTSLPADLTVDLSTSNQSETVTFAITATDNVGVDSVTWEGNESSSNYSNNTYNYQRTYNYNDYSVGSTNSDTISVVVADAAGNTTTKSITISIVTEDDQDPVISSLTSNKTSNIVLLPTSSQSNTVTFTVTATDNVTVNTVTLSGATYSSKSGNDWVFTKTYSYADFSFGDTFDTLTATATDGVGNSTTSSIQMVVRKSDDQSPTISSFSANDSTVELKTSSQSQTVTFTVVATDNRGISTVAVPGTTVGGVSGNNYTFNKTYSYGDYSFGETTDTLTATATDAAGNSSTQTVTISITKSDDQDPSITSFSADDSTVSLKTSSQSQTVTFTAIVTDNVAVTSVGLPGTSLSSSNSGTYVFTKTYSYADYSFGSTTDTLTLTVSDAARNSVSQDITISISKQDDQNPVISSFSADDTTVTLLTSSQSQTVTFTIAASDNVGVSSVSLPGASLSSASGGSYVFTKTYDYDDYSFGTTGDTLTATVTDTAGNSITDDIDISVTKSDDQSPAISSFTADDTTVELKTSAQSQTVTFTVVATDNVGVSSVSVPGTTTGSVSGNNYTFTKTYAYADYNWGSNTHVLTATATDAAGNTQSQQLTVTITKTDDEDPVISSFSTSKSAITVKTSAKTASATLTAVVTDNRAVTSVVIGGVNATNTSGNNYSVTKTYNYDNLSLGSSNDNITVTASDAAGNTETDTLTIALSVVDDEDPTITSLSSNATDDAIELTTTAQNQTVTFTAVATDNIAISSISLTGATQTNVSGSTYTFTKAYAYGDYNFGDNTDTLTLTVSDAAGNSSTSSITIDITKTDNQAPSISNFTANNTTVTVSTSSQTASINISATLSDNVAINSVSLPGATFVSNTGGSYLWTKSYSYGDYSFGNTTDTLTLTVTDTNSNSTSDTLDITVSKVDDQNPTITSFSVSSATVALTTSVQSVTRAFTVVASDNVAINTVSLPGTSLSSSNSGTYVFTKTYAYGDFSFGTSTDSLTVTVTDTAGNSTTDSLNVTVTKTDDQDPSIDSFGADDTSVSLATSSQTQTVTFTAVVSDNVAINTVSLPGTTLSSSNAGTYVFTKLYDYDDFGFGNSSETLTLTVTDTAGNSVTEDISITISKVDDQNPSISSFSANDTTVELTTSSQSQTVVFTVVASDNVAIDTVSVPGTTSGSVSGSSYPFSKTYSYSDFSFGNSSDTLTATVTDTAGNSVTENITISISKVDNQPPSISNLTSNATNNSIELKTSDQTKVVTFTVSVSDNETVSSVALSTATLTNSNAGTYTFTKSYDYDDYSFGDTTDSLTLTAIDNHSNSATATIDIIVTKTDDQAPSISNFTVSDNTIDLKSSSQSQSVTFSAVLSDNRAISSASLPNTTSNGNSGSTYNWSKTFSYSDYSYGTTTNTFTLTVVDAAGNTSTDSLDVTITKADDETPTITSFSANNTNVSLYSSATTQTVTFTAVASDNRAITAYSLPTATFSSNTGNNYVWTKTYDYDDYTYGSHSETLTVTFTDAAGNSSTATETISITKSDNLDPTITSFSADDTSVALTTSSQTQTVTFTAVATDNVAITTATLPTATYSGLSGSTYTWTKTYDYDDYNFGSSTDSLTLTVSDAAGNSSTDSVTINISKADNQDPTISSLTSNASGNAVELKSSDKKQTVIFTAVVSDNVGIDTIALSNASLSSANAGTYTFSKEFDYDDYSYGTTTSSHVLSVTDAAGNSAGQTINISVTKTDDQDPVIDSFTANNSSFNLYTSGTTSQVVTLTLVATDNRAVSSTSVTGGASLSSVSGSNYVYTKTINYSDLSNWGNNTFSFVATATDAAGNEDTASLSVVVAKIDNENPAISSFTASSTNVTLTTGSQSQTITFAASATDNRGITSMSLPTATATDTTGPDYAWSKTYNYDDYSFGSSTDVLTVTASDNAGNSSTSQVTINISKSDTQDPTITSFSASPSTVQLKTSDQTESVTFTAVASDNVGISTIAIPNTIYQGVSGSTYTFTKTFDYADYSFGNTSETHTLTVTDAAGNSVTEDVSITIQKIDDQNPTISSFTNNTSGNAIELKTSSQSQTITFTAVVSDNREVTSISLTGATQTSSNNGTYTFTKDYDYSDYNFGSNSDSLTLSVGDAAGNTSSQSVTISITKTDDQNPTISSFSADTTSVALKTSDQSKTVTITATLTDNVGITSVTMPGTNANISGNDYTFTKTYDYDDYSFGSSTDTLTLTVGDAAGNSSTESVTINISKSDDQNPSISSLSADDTSIEVKTSAQTQTVYFTAVVTDNVGINSISLTGATQDSVSGSSYIFSKEYDYADYNFGSNTDTLTLSVSDAAGNTATDTITITITKTDDQNPSITSLGADDTSVSLTTSSQTQTVTFTAVVSDNVGIDSISLTGATQTSSNAGTYTFTKTYDYDDYSFGSATDTPTLTVADAAGNSVTDTITINITKGDDENPVISSLSANNSTITVKTSDQSQTVTFTAVVTDNVGINSIGLTGATQTSVSGSSYTFTKDYDYDDYNFGSNTDSLTLTVADAAGNSVTDSITITINKTDDQDPVISSSSTNATNDTITLSTTSQSADVVFTIAATDNRAITSTTHSQLSSAGTQSGNNYTWTRTYDYDDFSFGSQTSANTITVADAAGNTATVNLPITVQKIDNQNPTISSVSADDSTVELKTSSQSQTVTFTVVATDNRAIDSVTLSGATSSGSSGNNYTFTKTYSYGDYSFGNSSDTLTATATDAAGNSATQTITVSISKTDDQNPSISSFGADDTSVELKTSSQTQTVTFTAVVSDNVGISTVSLPGTSLSSVNSGTYVFTKTYDYDDYSYGDATDTLTLTVTDTASNSVTDTVTISINKADDQNPSISSFSADDTTVELKTSSQTQTVTFTAAVSDNVAINSVSLPGTTLSSSNAGTYTFTKEYDYDDYSFGASSDTLTLTVSDTAGNSVTDTVTISITKSDDQNPSITSFGADDTSVTLATSSQTQTVTFTAVVTDNVAIQSVSLPGTTLSSSNAGTYVFSKTYDYDDYSFGSSSDTLTLTVTDTASNSVTDTVTISISKSDDQNPSISSFSADDTSVELKTSSQTQTVTFTVVATDNVAVSSVSLPGTTAGSVSGSNYTFTKEYDYDDYSFGDSSDTLTATVTDSANNSVTQDITISINKADDQDPTCNISANDTTVELKTSSQEQTVSFTVTVSDNVAINSVSLPGTTLLYTTTSGSNTQYNFRKTYDYDDYSFGDSSETLTATATDTAGNTATDSITISINKADDQNPSISSFTADDTSVEVKTSAKTQTVTFTVVASDNVAVSSVSIPGTTAGSVSGSNYTFTKEYDYDDLSYGSSSETLTATVTDSSNLTATDTITISISKVDDEDPSISSFGADDTTVELKTSSQTQTVTFTAVVSDNVGVNSVTLPGTTLSSAVSGTHIFTKTYDYDDYSFGDSSDTLTLTVADTAGQNGGTTNSITQDITISISKVDDQDPTCSVGADKNSIDLKTSAQTQTVTFTVTASDNASIGSVSLPGTTYSSTSGNDRLFTKTYDYDDYTFGDHSETLTATVVDGAGNTATDTITISISKIDDQVPTISSFSADDTSVELKSSDKTQTVTFTVVATDNVSVQTVSLPGTTFSSSSGSTSTYTKTYDYDDYDYGTTSETLTVTVTDSAGNTSTDTETITIVKSDDENPVISSFTSSKSAVSLTSTSQSDSVTFYAEFTDNRAVSSYSLPGASYQNLSNGVYSWTKSYSYSDYSYGTSTDTLTLTVEDAAGNSVTSSINISVTKSDNISPTISNLTVSTSTVDLYSSDKTETITISANISDNVGISTYSVQGATFSSVSNGVYTWTKTYDYDDYSYGSTSDNVMVIATDAAGNRSTSSSSLTINKYDDSVPYISSFTASPESFDLGTDNTSQTVTFSATMNDNVAITSYSLVDGDSTSLGSGDVSGNVYTWTKTYTLTDYSGNNHVQNFTVSASDAAGNSASSEVSVVIATLSALVVPGSLSITTATNLTSTDESVYALESRKERTAVLFNGDDLPDYYIKIPINLNNYVNKASSNLGRATGSPDDAWGLDAITIASSDVNGNQVTTVLPAQTGTFKVGQITINDDGVTSNLVNTTLTNFDVMMTISSSATGGLTSTCAVQRSDNSTSQTAQIQDSAAFASYLHFSDQSSPGNSGNNLVAASKRPAASWLGAQNAAQRDALEDKLTNTLTNQEVQTRFATAIAATNNSFNGQSTLSSWSMSFNAITPSSSSALTKHARARIGRKASPDTETIFRAGDKIFTSTSSNYNLTFRDHGNTLQTIASGDVYGVLEQTNQGALTGQPQN